MIIDILIVLSLMAGLRYVHYLKDKHERGVGNEA